MLNIAVVHHHLRGGGVANVIRHAANSLPANKVRLAVLTGEEPQVDLPDTIEVRIVPGLGYATGETGAFPDGAELSRRLQAAARELFGTAPDVWHVHNHSLGKNPAVTHAVARLAASGAPTLLQVHDFAEDGRPSNYRFLVDQLDEDTGGPGLNMLYPAGGRVHYALLNRRDVRRLSDAGLPAGRLHLLSNPVVMNAPDEDTAPPVTPGLVLYPTRAIRRKNLGELLLLAACAPDLRFAVTLAPKNPAAQEVYHLWTSFANSANLRVEFELGVRSSLSFPALLASARAVVTTSVAEGFGLAFLEPWLVGTPVIGRDLPEITRDFKEADVDLSGLYNRLDVPLATARVPELHATLAATMRETWANYRRPFGDALVERALAAAVRDGHVDFGCLDETWQRETIERYRSDAILRDSVRAALLGNVPTPATVSKNRARIAETYSPEAYGHRLLDLYRTVANTPQTPPDTLPASQVLDAFLSPEHFRLLRT